MGKDTEKTTTGSDEKRSVSFGVAGMTCASCVASVEKALKKVEGVSDARVNFAVEKATVDFDPNFVSREDLEKAVTDAGYKPVSGDYGGGSVSLGIGGMTCASCVASVEKALKKVEGVSDARVNLATGKAAVDFDPAKVTVSTL